MAGGVVEAAKVSGFLGRDEGELRWSAFRAKVSHGIGIAELAC
jgi:hypothetical protein